MLFIGDRNTGQFKRMISPVTIEVSNYNECVLYVLDHLGHFYTLTFPDRDLLIECMKKLCSTGQATARCDCELQLDEPNLDSEFHDREIEKNELGDRYVYR